MANVGPAVEHLDVLVVGAGISGIGAGRYLKTEHPSRSIAIFEGRAASGGTWDLFRYPGIRSDSDLHTFGYEFEPWTAKESIADAPAILSYLRETAAKHGVEQHIRYLHRVVAMNWSAAEGHWIVDVERGEAREPMQVTATWVFGSTGYYRYDEGFTPQLAGRERFEGTIIHPQHWPEDLDYTGKRVVVIGSGATAVTLVPAMADKVEHITMLQRTPTYVLPTPRVDAIAVWLGRIFGKERGYTLTREKNILQQRAIFQFCSRFPKTARRLIRRVNIAQLPEGYPVDVHFNPPYGPWDQRLCAVPDADLFKAISSGKASVVTNRIDTFTESGILLENGQELPADIIVTATGLNMRILGGIRVSIDGEEVSLADSVIYRGSMLSGIPNVAMAIGYTHGSWTLKVGLLCEYFCRLLGYMDEHGYDTVWPVADPGMSTRPVLDFEAGYVLRSLSELPKQGPAAPWLMSKNYHDDRKLLRHGDIVDENLHLEGAADRAKRTLPESVVARPRSKKRSDKAAVGATATRAGA